LVTPSSLEEARSLVGPGDAFIAGGTDLLPAMKHRLREPRRLISLSEIPELRGMDRSEGGALRVGAATTLTELADRAGSHPEWVGLAGAVRKISSPLLRNAGTVGGNLCVDTRCTYFNQPPIFHERWGPCLKMGGSVCHAVRRGNSCHAVYSGDLAGPLLALGATVGVAGADGRRRVAVSGLFSGDAATPLALAPDEIIVDVEIPRPPLSLRLSYQKCRLRDSIDFPLVGVSVCVWFEDGLEARISAARVVLNAAGPAPALVPEAGRILEGLPLTPELPEVSDRLGASLLSGATFVGNTAAGASYRRSMVTVLARRALRALVA
jgi:4-hydroxybenzoyl-CoA reductase subunit beta